METSRVQEGTASTARRRAERSRLGRVLNPRGLGPRQLVLQGLLCLSLALLSVDRLAQALYWPDEDATEVVLVSSEHCPFSRATKAHLDAHAVPYREIDARQDPFASGLAAWAFQSLRVPIVVVGPEVIHGYRADRIDEALARLGYEVGAASR